MADRIDTLQAAIKVVRAAARVCAGVQGRLVTADTLEKRDKSPVTIADFAAQAIVCVHVALRGECIVAEENSRELRMPEHAAVRSAVVEHVRRALGYSGISEEQVLAWIDLGGHEPRGGSYWVLDPIDGTKGFLRREQYAIALALLQEGEPVVGVLGCPNLSIRGGTGALFAAARGLGAWEFPLWDDSGAAGEPVSAAALRKAAEGRFCESVESGHSNQDESARIAARLGITSQPLRIDSQCKYAAVARGDASIYLRMPTSSDYREKVWDHAAGALIVEEAGGRVSDVNGRALDFSRGRTLERNRGVVATCGSIHNEVIEAILAVRSGAVAAA